MQSSLSITQDLIFRLAKALKKYNIKVIYYISPQVWAWKESRVKIIKKYIDHMLVFFEFEKEFYKKHHISVDFIGHPFVDTIKPTLSKQEISSFLKISPKCLTVGILPGSRQKEIDHILPIMLEAAQLLYKEKPEIQFLLIKSPTIKSSMFEVYLNKNPLPLKIVEQHYYDVINICDLCMITSGTATLEAALINTPMVVVYKTSFLTWLLAKLLIKIPYIALVNIIAKKKVVPEYIQYQATGKNIALEILNIVNNTKYQMEMKNNLKQVCQSLGHSGANKRAAEYITTFLKT